MRVVSVVDARPQFIEAAVVSRVLRRAHEEVLSHRYRRSEPQARGNHRGRAHRRRPDVRCRSPLRRSRPVEARLPGVRPQSERLLVTVYRPSNADHPERLRAVVHAISSTGRKVLFPLHTRTRKTTEESKITGATQGGLQMTERVDYLASLSLLVDAEGVLTESRGVQKEATFWRAMRHSEGGNGVGREPWKGECPG